jgi:hypothetical protein
LLASKDWMTKSVAISSLALRTSITLQAGIATSMLAGLALERSSALFPQLALVSTIRNSNSGPYNLAWLLWSPHASVVRKIRGSLLPVFASILATITFLAQFTSTVLLSDIRIGLVSGYVLPCCISPFLTPSLQFS